MFGPLAGEAVLELSEAISVLNLLQFVAVAELPEGVSEAVEEPPIG